MSFSHLCFILWDLSSYTEILVRPNLHLETSLQIRSCHFTFSILHDLVPDFYWLFCVCVCARARACLNLPVMQETLVWSLGQESPREGIGYPLQYSCLKNPMDRGAWRATVAGVAKSQIWLSNFHYGLFIYAYIMHMLCVYIMCVKCCAGGWVIETNKLEKLLLKISLER